MAHHLPSSNSFSLNKVSKNLKKKIQIPNFLIISQIITHIFLNKPKKHSRTPIITPNHSIPNGSGKTVLFLVSFHPLSQKDSTFNRLAELIEELYIISNHHSNLKNKNKISGRMSGIGLRAKQLVRDVLVLFIAIFLTISSSSGTYAIPKKLKSSQLSLEMTLQKKLPEHTKFVSDCIWHFLSCVKTWAQPQTKCCFKTIALLVISFKPKLSYICQILNQIPSSKLGWLHDTSLMMHMRRTENILRNLVSPVGLVTTEASWEFLHLNCRHKGNPVEPQALRGNGQLLGRFHGMHIQSI
ncbi:hypothetical protein VP01_2285g2 [Puccinia sorghi]|uniref:Uncharacterized protein n=1 Tax=Puccinia sorghi TaxID=27349 RepID=A0A0L6V850_9BASI|nr:hypothetical protein VP01_2285g2 [Puccinia sorghi]